LSEKVDKVIRERLSRAYTVIHDDGKLKVALSVRVIYAELLDFHAVSDDIFKRHGFIAFDKKITVAVFILTHAVHDFQIAEGENIAVPEPIGFLLRIAVLKSCGWEVWGRWP